MAPANVYIWLNELIKWRQRIVPMRLMASYIIVKLYGTIGCTQELSHKIKEGIK